MTDDHTSCLLVIKKHTANSFYIHLPVYHNDRYTSIESSLDGSLTTQTRSNYQPFNTTSDIGFYCLRKIVRILVKTRELHHISLFCRNDFYISAQMREKAIGNIRHHYAYRIGPATP